MFLAIVDTKIRARGCIVVPPFGFQEVEAPVISIQSAYENDKQGCEVGVGKNVPTPIPTSV
jgi:hypothetical protein